MPILCVCGGIAAGKSTVLDALEAQYPVMKEPIDAWMPYLRNLNDGVKGAADALQHRVIDDRVFGAAIVEAANDASRWTIMVCK